MVVYSFCGERLSEHSYLTLRLYMTAFGEWHERVTAKKLGLEDPRELSCALRTACLLHDVGKALKKFQERVRQDKKAGFPFHEIVSSYFTFKTLVFYIEHKSIAAAAALAVLQHHQAMRSIEETLIDGLKRLPLDEGMEESVIEEIKMAASMSEGMTPIIKNFEEVFEHEPKHIKEELSKFIGKLKSWLKTSAPGDEDMLWNYLKHIQPMFNAPLQLSDNLAAFLVRGGSFRMLHAETIKLLKFRELKSC